MALTRPSFMDMLWRTTCCGFAVDFWFAVWICRTACYAACCKFTTNTKQIRASEF